MLDSDPYGDLGAIADASWSERWMCWDRQAQDAYLASVADWGPLHLEQMEHLIQGLLPPTYGWLCLPTVLSEFQPLIFRLRQDIDRGVMSKAPTPNEFAAWCDQMGVELPAPFVQALLAASSVPAAPTSALQSTASMVLPGWAAMLGGTSKQPKPRSLPKRGRPPTTEPTNDVLCKDGRRILMDAARRGEVMTLRDVAAQLQATPSGHGKQIDNIERRIKGALPIQQAKATATKHQLAGTQRRQHSLY